MDGPWHAMTAQEQARMRGLSADLHALRDGGPERVEMTPAEVAAWHQSAKEAYAGGEAGDLDTALAFWRQPSPSKLPPQIVPFLQARAWEKLGDLETALVFMTQAFRFDPDQALSVMLLLQHLERVQEAQDYADQVIENDKTPPLELYLAATVLLHPTRYMSDVEAAPTLQRAASVLRRALKAYVAAPTALREVPDADAYIAHALGLTLERLGDREDAIKTYSEAIARHPFDGELFTARGIVFYRQGREEAFADFVNAVHHGTPVIWPYLLLARHAFDSGAFAQTLRYANAGQDMPGPNSARADLYELIAMALAQLNQPPDWVLQNFDEALKLDPANARIQENRSIAKAFAAARRGPGARPNLRQPTRSELVQLVRSSGESVYKQSELLSEQRSQRLVAALAASD
jgi:tetratricopeptide (TPR) repeat protein